MCCLVLRRCVNWVVMNNKAVVVCVPLLEPDGSLIFTLRSLGSLLLRSQFVTKVVISINKCDEVTEGFVIDSIKRAGVDALAITIIRQNEYLTFDRHIEQIINLVDGDYIWFLGCGEIVNCVEIRGFEARLATFEGIYLKIGYDVYSHVNQCDIVGKNLSGREFFSILISGFLVSVSHAREALWRLRINSNGWLHVSLALQLSSELGPNQFDFYSKPVVKVWVSESGWYSRPDSFVAAFALRNIICEYEGRLPRAHLLTLMHRHKLGAVLRAIHFAKSNNGLAFMGANTVESEVVVEESERWIFDMYANLGTPRWFCYAGDCVELARWLVKIVK